MDGDDVDLSYEWLVDGVLTSTTAAYVNRSELISGQVWEVRVTPSDRTSVGETASASVTITNGAPVIDSVAITPNPARVLDELAVDINATDSDGHAVTYTYDWSVNGVSAGVPAETFSGAFQKGDEVSVVVTPNDGFVDGSPVTASTLLENTPPILTGVAIREVAFSEASSWTTGLDGTIRIATLKPSWWLGL